jgi:Na+-transporting methylmalonyl-CoA/oxaloacetate decarboxylase gamma subunit
LPVKSAGKFLVMLLLLILAFVIGAMMAPLPHLSVKEERKVEIGATLIKNSVSWDAKENGAASNQQEREHSNRF